MVKGQCSDNKLINVVRKGGRSEEKYAPTLFPYLSKHPHTWTSITRSKSGSKRCGKNSRIRWNNSNNNNYVRVPDVTKEGFTQQEEELIIKLHAAVGSRWGLIAHQLPGRTENEIKNQWNTKLRKKLSEMGIDPITHKPFSQILADYGNIGGSAAAAAATAAAGGGGISRSSSDPHNNNYIIGTITGRDYFNKHNKLTPFTTSNSSTSLSNNSQLSHTTTTTTTTTTSSMSMSMSMSIMSGVVGQNSISNHNNNSNSTSSSSSSASASLDLLCQLQAISLVTEGPPTPTPTATLDDYSLINNDFGQAARVAPPPNSPADLGFSWHDFLLEAEEPINNYYSKPSSSSSTSTVAHHHHHNQQQQQLGMNNNEFSMTITTTTTDHHDDNNNNNNNNIQAAAAAASTIVPSSSNNNNNSGIDNGSSFLEAMLHQEDYDIFLSFPSLMEEPLY